MCTTCGYHRRLFGRASSRLFDWSSRAGGAEPPVDVGKIRGKKKKYTEKKFITIQTYGRTENSINAPMKPPKGQSHTLFSLGIFRCCVVVVLYISPSS